MNICLHKCSVHGCVDSPEHTVPMFDVWHHVPGRLTAKDGMFGLTVSKPVRVSGLERGGAQWWVERAAHSTMARKTGERQRGRKGLLQGLPHWPPSSNKLSPSPKPPGCPLIIAARAGSSADGMGTPQTQFLPTATSEPPVWVLCPENIIDPNLGPAPSSA